MASDYQPARYDPVGNKQRGSRRQVERQEDPRMHAKVQNSKLSSPLQILSTTK